MKIAAVVVTGILIEAEQHHLALIVGHIVVARGHRKPRHPRHIRALSARIVGVVHIEIAVVDEIRMKSQTEQPLLAGRAQHPVLDVEECSDTDDPDRPRLFHDKKPAGAVARTTDPDRVVVSSVDRLQGEISRWIGGATQP